MGVRRTVPFPKRPGLLATAVAAVVATGLSLAGAAPASAAPPSAPQPSAATGEERSGPWRLVRTPTSARLVWTAREALPVGGARVEVLADRVSLGPARVARNGRTVTVAVPAGSTLASLGELEVVAAGRRLDAEPSAAARARPAPSAGAAAASALPPIAQDPGRPGPYRTTTGEYSLKDLAVPGLAARVEVRGVVVAPVGAPGRRPLVLLLHGRHSTCFRGGPAGETSIDWPCRAGWAAIPSHRGYLQAQKLLASQGYDTVSIAANGVNGQDGDLPDGGAAARSVLVRHHLGLWATWSSSAGRASAPAAVRAAPPADLRRVLLAGHSRGGEGVNRAALDTVAPRDGDPAPAWRVAGLLHLAPTAFGQNPAPGVPVAVVLPSCDGDVYDLQGQSYVDDVRELGPDVALRSSVLVVGANHNYFNAEWTPGVAKAPAGDDWFDDSDPVCGRGKGSQRLSAARQRAVGATYIAAAARVLVARDARVLPLLDGTPVRAASAGSARVLAHAVGGNRRLVAKAGTTIADQGPAVRGSGSVSARLCLAFAGTASSACDQLAAVPGVQPHLRPFSYIPGEPTRRAVSVRWSRAKGSAVVTPRAVASLKGSSALALRVAVPPGSKAASFVVRVTDARKRSADLGQVTLAGLPRGTSSGVYWARELRLPLTKARKLDLRHVTRVVLVPRSAAGNLLLLDAWGWSAGLSEAKVLRLPRLDVGRLTVDEGSSTRTVTVPVTVSSRVRTALPQRVWIAVTADVPDHDLAVSVVTLPPGRRTIPVPIVVRGDERDDLDVTPRQVVVKPVSGLVAADYVGGVDVRDDDPTPALTVAPVTTAVTEGGTLTWRFTLSEPSDLDVFVPLAAVAPAAGGRELSTDDVPADWLEPWLGQVPAPPVTLSAADLHVFAIVPAGRTSVDLLVPTVADSRTEGGETLTLAPVAEVEQPPTLPASTRLVGTVTDPAGRR